jgi:hypothetical protein
MRAMLKRPAESRMAEVFAAPSVSRPAGWWRDDQVEQLRNYQSWVYAAVNAIGRFYTAIRDRRSTSRSRCHTRIRSCACWKIPTRG